MTEIASFRAKLDLLAAPLDDPNVTEITVNGPGEYWLARQGQRHMDRIKEPGLDFRLLDSLAEVIASYTNQGVDVERPLLSATIPVNLDDDVPDNERGGYRVQVVKPPAVPDGTIAICIRKPTLLSLTLENYERMGAFELVNQPVVKDQYSDNHLLELYREKQWKEFLRGAVRAHKNIVVSAGTNAGKTTILNALLKEVPITERIVTIEDAREIKPPQPNSLHLLFSRGEQGVAKKVDPVALLEAMMRLTPDRPIMGELRGREAYAYLELLNSGHDGSMTSIHSKSPKLMYDRLAQMVMRFGSTLGKDSIIEYARSLIDVVIQFHYAPNGRRYISEIHYEGA